MTVANKFFAYPFGTAGDLTAIPNPTQVGGSVSYQSGFTVNYQDQLGVNPSALPINRAQFNQLMNDITTAAAQYQSEGTPQWIPASQTTNAAPFPYDIYARVRYNVSSPGTEGAGNQVYENQVQGNTATPGADNTWIVISGNITGVPTGTIIDHAGTVGPAGYLACFGTPELRATYPALFAVLTFVQSGVLASSTTITGLTNTQLMFQGMPLEGTGIQAGTTVATIINSTSITISLAATTSATENLTFFPWGNGNGSTTFNLPDLQRRVGMGSNGNASTDPLGVGNQIGQTGGQESHTQTMNELAAHSHTITNTQPGSGGTGTTTLAGGTTTTGTTGVSQPFNIIQPVAIVSKVIKY